MRVWGRGCFIGGAGYVGMLCLESSVNECVRVWVGALLAAWATGDGVFSVFRQIGAWMCVCSLRRKLRGNNVILWLTGSIFR